MAMTDISFANRVSVPPDVLFRVDAGQSLILNLKTKRYSGLNDVGTRMWTVLTTSDSIQAAYQSLLIDYDVDAERLRRDLEDLIERLVEQGLLEVSSPP